MIDDISVMQCEACWSQSIKVFGSFLWLFTVCSKIEARNFRAMPQITESRIIVASVTLPRKKWGKKRVFLACRQERHLLPKKGKKIVGQVTAMASNEVRKSMHSAVYMGQTLHF